MLVPRRLVVTIGGFGGPHHEVRWSRGKLRYRSDDSEASVVPSAADWDTFWAALDQIGVWSWRAQYDNPEILDGTQWALDIRDGSQRVQSFGSNLYPGGNDLEHARPFQEFLAAMSALIRRPFGQ